MGKIRRGNFIFTTWIGDHGRHVHVSVKNKPDLKWDLIKNEPLKGNFNKRLLRIIQKLRAEGKI